MKLSKNQSKLKFDHISIYSKSILWFELVGMDEAQNEVSNMNDLKVIDVFVYFHNDS